MPITHSNSIEYVREVGLQCNLILIDDNYKNSRSPLKWLCPNKKHIIKVSFGNVSTHVSKGSVYNCSVCVTSRFSDVVNTSSEGIIILDTFVDIAWNKKQTNYYDYLGYNLANASIRVLIKDVPSNSPAKVRVKCPLWFCGREYIRQIRHITMAGHTYCTNCVLMKKTMDSVMGIRTGKLVVTGYAKPHFVYNTGAKHAMVECTCDCGNKTNALIPAIKGGVRKSCGCDRYQGECLLRAFLELIFNDSFGDARPRWLRSRNNTQLQLDCYNEELGIAFEHQGQQHYKFSPLFHTDVDDFKFRQGRDADKRIRCKEAGVLLIEIPELFTLTKANKLKSLIEVSLQSAGLNPPPYLDFYDIDRYGNILTLA